MSHEPHIEGIWNAAREKEPKATPAGMSASLTPEGFDARRLKAADVLAAAVRRQHEATQHGETGLWLSVYDAMRRYEEAAAQAAKGAAGKSVPPPTTSGTPS